MTQFIYAFNELKPAFNFPLKDLLGGKGANLAEMSKLGFPVPPGFTITTEACKFYYKNGRKLSDEICDQIWAGVGGIEKVIGKNFGDEENPLLFSVRSGARASMPGMMDTILNLGLNDKTVVGIATKTQNPRFAYDSYRRFIQMYCNVVMDLSHHDFEMVIEDVKQQNNAKSDLDLSVENLKEIIARFKEIVKEETGKEFPQDVKIHLIKAVEAVFASWMNDRAITYRKLNDIPEEWGTAVNIQSMVFGNMGNNSATGVVFTRNPSNGEDKIYGEYLINAQGEDVVAGIRTPQSITSESTNDVDIKPMEEALPELYKELVKLIKDLEAYYKDMQDVEFTIQEGKLYILQTRNGKRTAKAAVKIAVDMVKSGMIEEKDAILRINPESLNQLLHATIDSTSKKERLTKALPASPGAAMGVVVFSSEEVERLYQNHDVILVRNETSPEDIKGMYLARGIITARGGMTSHAAVVARGMGKPCVSGASEIKVNYEAGNFAVGSLIVKAGDKVTIDGGTGEIFLGEVKMSEPEFSEEFLNIMNWADKYRRLKVRANAETAEDSKVARRFGAEGIGLCRTEHMFFSEDRIDKVREMILSGTAEKRKIALGKLLDMQIGDFREIFKIMDGFPVTIRLLDPPLHEFLPQDETGIDKLSRDLDISMDEVRARVRNLHEVNPMLGHRGCRLGISYPEIYEMQALAIFKAFIDARNCGSKASLEIMLPIISTEEEVKILKKLIDEVAEKIKKEENANFDYMIGTMIELPRAALIAGKIAKHAEFFSFGTNDLTQTTFGISRDDFTNFLGTYQEKLIFEKDPFTTIDIDGVGELISIASKRGREVRSGIKLGICGEHGGDPESIKFCHNIGLDYVSCSPYRVPIARLTAATAHILEMQK